VADWHDVLLKYLEGGQVVVGLLGFVLAAVEFRAAQMLIVAARKMSYRVQIIAAHQRSAEAMKALIQAFVVLAGLTGLAMPQPPHYMEAWLRHAIFFRNVALISVALTATYATWQARRLRQRLDDLA